MLGCILCIIGIIHLLVKILDLGNHVLICVVVDKNVNCAHLLQRLVDNLLAVLAVLQVSCECVALGALLLNQLLGLLCILLLLGQVGNEAVGTLHGVKDGCCAANTRVTTSDDGLLALQLASSLVELLAAIGCGEVVVDGLGVELVLKTGDLVLLLDLGLVAWVC
jgi:hypothetical protein